MIPKNLKYGSKVESAPARSIRSNIQPQVGTKFSLNELIQINIPTRQNLVLVPTESYLKFNFRVGSNAEDTVFRWDSCGAHGLIQRIRVYHGSNLLEDIDNYNLLSKMLHDIQIPTDSTYGKLALLEGTRPDMIATTPTFLAAAVGDGAGVVATLSNRNIRVQSISSGDVLKRTAAGVTTHLIDDTQSTNVETYCLNLVSLVGSLCSQNYLPLFAMTSAPLRLEIQLVDDLRRAMNCSAAPNAASNALTFLDNVEFVAQMIELSDSAMSIISSSLGGSPLQFVIPSYRNYQYALTTTEGVATQANFPIAAKFSSLKSLFVTHRDKINTATFFPMSCVTAGLSDYQFRVGSVPVPAKAVNTRAEQFAELLKAIGSLSDISHQPSIELPAFNLGISQANTNVTDAIAASGIHSGAFYVGLNLENYEASAKDTIFAGWNSNTDDIYYVANLTVPQAGGAAAPVTIRFDAFALYDAVVVCENQTAYVRF
jgi:hypothetical protein